MEFTQEFRELSVSKQVQWNGRIIIIKFWSKLINKDTLFYLQEKRIFFTSDDFEIFAPHNGRFVIAFYADVVHRRKHEAMKKNMKSKQKECCRYAKQHMMITHLS